jgi:hypothetical protein
MKRLAQNPKRISNPNECAALLRRRNNLEDAIRQDRIEIARLDARIRSLEIQRTDLRAEDHKPGIAAPSVERDADGSRPRFNPRQWLAEQTQEFVHAIGGRRERDREIAGLNRTIESLRYDRNQRRHLMEASIAGKARLLQQMRRIGCAQAGTTNY